MKCVIGICSLMVKGGETDEKCYRYMQSDDEEEARSMKSAIGMFRRMCARSCKNISLAGILLLQEYPSVYALWWRKRGQTEEECYRYMMVGGETEAKLQFGHEISVISVIETWHLLQQVTESAERRQN